MKIKNITGDVRIIYIIGECEHRSDWLTVSVIEVEEGETHTFPGLIVFEEKNHLVNPGIFRMSKKDLKSFLSNKAASTVHAVDFDEKYS